MWVPISVRIVCVGKFGLNIISRRDKFIFSFFILNVLIKFLNNFFTSSLIWFCTFIIEPILLEISLNSVLSIFGTASCNNGNFIFLF